MKKVIIVCDHCKKGIHDMQWESHGDRDYHMRCYRARGDD